MVRVQGLGFKGYDLRVTGLRVGFKG